MSIVDDQMKYHELQAMWWMHSASNGHCEVRNITNLGTNEKLTPGQLRDDAMRTSQKHMELFAECMKYKQDVKEKTKKCSTVKNKNFADSYQC